MSSCAWRLLAALWLLAWAALAAGGCAGPRLSPEPAPAPGQEPDRYAVGPIPDDIPPLWRPTAARLSGRGLGAEQLSSVFTSPELSYSPSAMETKLRELYGIFYQSELTLEIQRMLYQLGYDIVIDGRNGPGTQRTIKKFQAEAKLPQTGDVSLKTKKELSSALKGRRLRALSGYRPPERPPLSQAGTYGQFTNPSALKQISEHFKADRAVFRRMTRRCGVPGELVAAIMWVETGYGSYLGRHRAASQLASMSAAALDFSVIEPVLKDLASERKAVDFLRSKAVERGEWALDELTALLEYAFDNGLDPTTFPSSIYGAIGWGQFMPSNVVKYGVDGNGDGRVDLFDKHDAIFSIGNYFRAHGWRGSFLSGEDKRQVVLKYNKSGVYVNTVLYVAEHLAAGD